MKPILCLDFDGVVHSYKSGWKGPRCIPDPPVPGALEFIVKASEVATVAIHSSRSGKWGGRRAMKFWLLGAYLNIAPSWEKTPEWFRDHIAKTAFADPWQDEVRFAVRQLGIQWPMFKPAAMVTIDDRGYRFDGTWPDLKTVLALKPWYKP